MNTVLSVKTAFAVWRDMPDERVLSGEYKEIPRGGEVVLLHFCSRGTDRLS